LLRDSKFHLIAVASVIEDGKGRGGHGGGKAVFIAMGGQVGEGFHVGLGDGVVAKDVVPIGSVFIGEVLVIKSGIGHPHFTDMDGTGFPWLHSIGRTMGIIYIKRHFHVGPDIAQAVEDMAQYLDIFVNRIRTDLCVYYFVIHGFSGLKVL
jgi:hypothetical protein